MLYFVQLRIAKVKPLPCISTQHLTPHLHIDFVPYVSGWKGKGLDTKVSLKQALKALGFAGGSKRESELNQWINAEKEQLAAVMERHGINRNRSIKNPQRDQVSQNAATTYVPKVQQPEEDFMFNDRDLNYYWQEYAGQLPKEQDALAKRMQMLRPALLNNSTTFEVVVDNEFAAKDFTALIPELQDYLRGRLKNSKVMMTVRVSEATETVRPVGRVEKFQMMAQKNQALMQLKDEFGLELY